MFVCTQLAETGGSIYFYDSGCGHSQNLLE